MAIKQYDRSGTTTLSVVNDLALLVKKAKFDKENPNVVYRGKTSFTYGKNSNGDDLIKVDSKLMGRIIVLTISLM